MSALAGSKITKSNFNSHFHSLCFSCVQAEHSQPGSKRTGLYLRAHNKTRQIKERLRDTGFQEL